MMKVKMVALNKLYTINFNNSSSFKLLIIIVTILVYKNFQALLSSVHNSTTALRIISHLLDIYTR